MPITFYACSDVPSPPARAVEMVIKIIKLDVEYRHVSLHKKEHLQPWFVKLNPLHQVPVLDDNGYVLTDSHAIIAYLLAVYAPKDILEQYYPTDPKERGIIDSRWHFENGILFARVKTILLPITVWGVNDTSLENAQWLIESIDFLETLLEGTEWLAGDRLTVADISTLTAVDVAELVIPLRHYKNVSAWAERARKTIPFYNEVGTENLKNFGVFLKKNFTYDPETRWNQIKGIANE